MRGALAQRAFVAGPETRTREHGVGVLDNGRDLTHRREKGSVATHSVGVEASANGLESSSDLGIRCATAYTEHLEIVCNAGV